MDKAGVRYGVSLAQTPGKVEKRSDDPTGLGPDM
jgi:hypothetical protein